MSSRIRVGVVSDTHGTVLPGLESAFRNVDMILHAGDIDNLQVLNTLALIAPVTAVRGNMDSEDWAYNLPQQVEVSLGDIHAVLRHDRVRLNRQILSNPCSLIICGHTHQRMWEHTDDKPGSFILNPGCAGTRTSQPSAAVLDIECHKMDCRFVEL